MSTLLLRFGIILEKLHDCHERSGKAVKWKVGIREERSSINYLHQTFVSKGGTFLSYKRQKLFVHKGGTFLS